MSTIKYIGTHHFAGNLTLAQLNAEHKARWPEFPSKLRPDLWVGYNFVIWKDGTYLQARYIGEETAAQKGHNTDCVSICLAGDFTKGKEKPTFAQQETLKWLIQVIVAGVAKAERNNLKVWPGTVISIVQSDILPHRILQPNHTECHGTSLPDNWGRVLAFPPTPPPPPISDAPVPPPGVSEGAEIGRLQKIIELLAKLIGLQELLRKTQLGAAATNPCWQDVRG